MYKKVILVLILVVAAMAIYFGLHWKKQNQPHACTLEAKICPDGTSVGRTGPSCEFAACPNEGATSTPPIQIQKVENKKNPIGVLTGHFTVFPTCPVEKTPPEPACAPKPYAALINIVSGNGKIIQVHADMAGKFYVPLPVGSYTIIDASSVMYPRCDSKKATVSENKVTTADVSCDSGIR